MLRNVIFVGTLGITFPATADENRETVLLKYAAEAGATYSAEIDTEIIKVKNGIESVQRSISGRMRMQLQEHPDGILARSDLVDIKVETENLDLNQYMNPFYEEMYSVSMSAVIAESGEFLRLEGMQSILEAKRDSVSKLIQNSPDELKAMQTSFADTWLNREAILVQVKQNWILEVQQWVGSEFEKGYVYEVEYIEEVPEFGNVDIAFNGEYEYLGKVPCNDRDDDLSCVELNFQSSLKPEIAKALTEAISKNQNPAFDQNNLMTLDLNFRLITEPSTLRAHQFEMVKVIWAPEDNGLSWAENIASTRVTYRYD